MAFLADSSAFEIAALIRSGEVSSLEVTEACLVRIRERDPIYHAYVTVLEEQALHRARNADAEVRRHKELGALHGVPVSIKDVFLLQGTPTTAGSVMLLDYSPDDLEDATVVRRLRQAGAVILGKVGVGSGMAGDMDSPSLELPRNPWRLDCTPGGSSSGSAVSLALGMGYGSVGTDQGGSVRNPAAFTGVVGLKPTYGRISQYGDVYSLCRTLEHVGPLARTVRDAALLLGVLAGVDAMDPTTVDADMPDLLSRLDEGLESNMRLRIGWVREGGPLGGETDVLDRVERAVGLLEETGVGIEEITLPLFSETLWYQMTLLEEWESLERSRTEPSQYLGYIWTNLKGKRQKVMQQISSQVSSIRRAYLDLFGRFDLIVLPTAPITAKPFQMRRLHWAGEERDTFDLHLCNTWMFNVTGHPAISLPCGLDAQGLPVGLQIVGRHYQEDVLLQVAAAYEQRTGGFPMLKPQ